MKNAKGYALLDLMIVIIIVAVLFGTVLPRVVEMNTAPASPIISEECFIDETDWNDAFRLQATRRSYFDCDSFNVSKDEKETAV